MRSDSSSSGAPADSAPAPDALRASPEAALADAGAALVQGNPEQALTLAATAWRTLGAAMRPASFAAAVCRFDARIALTGGEVDAALDSLAAALAIAQANGDTVDVADATNHLAIVHFQRGDVDRAEALWTEALAAAVAVGERRIAAAATTNLGIIANVRGNLPTALAHYQRSLAEYRALGASSNIVAGLNNLGRLHAALGERDAARRAYQEAVGICTVIGDLDALAHLHVNLAELWVSCGDLQRAQDAYVQAHAVSQRTRQGAARGELHKVMGVVAREREQHAEAEAHFAIAETAARERRDLLLLAETAREQADLARRRGRNREVLTFLNRAHRLFTQLRARRDVADVGRRMGRLEEEFVEVARKWGESIEAKDRYTQGHCQRVADLSCAIAERAAEHGVPGFDEQSLFWFRIGALLHDVGKLVIPAEVLNKPGKLTDEEWALMRSHPSAGVEMLAEVEFPWDVQPIIESHHERWDGKGYPHGLAGEAIPLVARILCVADVYDALTSVRSYKRSLTHDEAMEILRRDIGAMFDPTVFAWFEEVAVGWAPRTAAHQAAATQTRDLPPPPSPLADPLTGLPLRREFLEEGERVLAARAGSGRPVAVLRIVVRDVAECGATHGAAVGELLLRMVAEALCRNTRGGDSVGRLDDDEFVLMLPDVTPLEARQAVARLEGIVTRLRVPVPGDQPVAMSVSVSTSLAVSPDDGTTAAALVAAAGASLGREPRAARPRPARRRIAPAA